MSKNKNPNKFKCPKCHGYYLTNKHNLDPDHPITLMCTNCNHIIILNR